ncbi:MAG: hypothetical protein ACREP6_01050 [Candidatus Binataceae bacterium]
MPKTTTTLGMVFHELATNAAKYGAFSAPDGRVEISWTVSGEDSTRRLEIQWVERDGPALDGEISAGFGRNFIQRAVSFELNGEARMEFTRSGLRCVLTLPVDFTNDTSGPVHA